MQLWGCLKTGSKRNKSTFVFIILLLTTSAAGFAEDMPAVSAELDDGVLQLRAEGVPVRQLERALEDGLRTMLRFEAQMRVRRMWRWQTVRSADAGYIARLDPFDGTVELKCLSGHAHTFSRDEWYDHFVTARIIMNGEIPESGEIRVRAVWDPVLLIPGLRFLRVIIPGMRRNGPWVTVQGHGGDTI